MISIGAPQSVAFAHAGDSGGGAAEFSEMFQLFTSLAVALIESGPVLLKGAAPST